MKFDKIIFATTNKGKLDEIKMILSDLNVDVISMAEAGIDIEIVEDGTTFEENATIKANKIMEITNTIVLADDSGLEVDYLNKEPGIYSARYMGTDTSYEIKNNYIIEQLKDAKNSERSARFVCAIAAAIPEREPIIRRATIEGIIADKPLGENGFGYDPILFVPEYNMTTAQMPMELKNSISHRGKALELVKRELKKILLDK